MRPSYLKSGSPARLFPVLSMKSKEGRTTSIVLSCMTMIREFAYGLLGSIDVSFGRRSRLIAYTECVFDGADSEHDRPDGLIIVERGKSQWRALVETKIAKAELSADQIERYRQLARKHGIDCVITISNQFATSPQLHPLTPQLNKRLRIPVYHWSWMFILTMADLLHSNDEVGDEDQRVLLNELRRFLSHESAGVEGFNKLPPEWALLVKTLSTGGSVAKGSPEVSAVADAWQQEAKDLSLIMTRKLDVLVKEKLPKKLRSDPALRRKSIVDLLAGDGELRASFDVPDAATTLDVAANLGHRSVYAGMRLKAPDDRVSSKARLNWLLRQIKVELSESYFIRCHWPGRATSTQCSVAEIRNGGEGWEAGREHLQVSSFEVFRLEKTGSRFGQLENFVTDLERLVPEFYEAVGQNLSAWKKSAPKVKPSATSVEEISEEAETLTSEELD